MGMKNMNIDRNRTKLSTIALILLLAISATLVTLTSVYAQDGKATVCYLGAIPNPVGKDQQVLLHVGITDALPSPEQKWVDMSVTITDPEGGTTTISNIETDSTGGTGVPFTPDKVGTYTLVANFPEQVQRGTTYLASHSPEVQLEVQEETIEVYPGHSLPDNYWTRPIDAQLREWSKITGSWPLIATNLYAPYNDGPETAHILWTKVLTQGGLVGGALGEVSFEIGDAYEGKWTGSGGTGSWFESTSIILTGKLYYQESDQENPIVYHCVDLHTGEELWSKVFMDNDTIAFGQTYHFDGINYHGAFEYLYVTSGGGFFGGGGGTWHAFDSLTGVWMFDIENAPSGTNLYGPKGEICQYSVSGTTLRFWNSSHVVLNGLSMNSAGSWGSNAHGRVHDGNNGYMWEETIESGLGSASAYFLNDRVILTSASTSSVTVSAVNVNPADGAIGRTIFKTVNDAPAHWAEMRLSISGMQSGFVSYSKDDHVAILWVKDTREHYAYSLDDGTFMWSTPSQDYMDAMDDTPGSARAIAYGKFYSASVSGTVYCYDIQTGDELWTYEAVDPYSEYLFGNNWWLKPLFITDGKIYVAHLEHSPIDPMPRGGPFICLNATDGTEIWRINGAFRQTRWGGRAIIGDSIIATMDTYDQRVYGIGKGASSTTVKVTPKIVAKGSTILIEGTVMDVSPGTEDTGMKLRFPNGVPAISDEDMSEWMLYVYKQFEMPEDATGVEVVFNWVDAEGVWHDLYRTTTDTSGTYSYAWTPDTEGTIKIIATFAGSEGYYGSCAQTAIVVGPPEEHFPTAAEIGDTTVSKIPAYPAASDIAQETVNKLPAYLTIDLIVLIIAV
ncbi:MAG: PQQ-binding-like beta-propeller repeat protein, partial [Candidatus Bathyarchaeota archaeon]